MLVFVAFALIALSLLVEWTYHLVKENYELRWPTQDSREAIERRAKAARMRLWTALN